MPRAPVDPAAIALGARVRAYRLALDISQERLAELADVHRNYIGLLERGEMDPTFGRLVRIARALGIEVPELVRLEQ